MIYLDHYRTTPVLEAVVKKMTPFLREAYFLPESFTKRGTEAAEVIDQSNRVLLDAFNLEDGEVVYTSGGTASNNIVISGVLRDVDLREAHIVCTVIDHPSIVNTYEYYRKKGASVTFLKVDGNGLIDPEELRKHIQTKTVLISLTHTNHTIGAIQPLEQLLPIIKEQNPKTRIHIDATMSLNAMALDLSQLPIDFLTFSGHKIYGPKGVGAIVFRKSGPLKPILFGTVTTSPFSPGAENIPGIVGLSEALRIATAQREAYLHKMRPLQERTIKRIESEIPDVVLNGPRPHPEGNLHTFSVKRAIDNINFSFRYVEGESIMMFLDFEDIIVATGSACASSDLKVNYVLSAIGRDHEMAHGSLRITPGWGNDEEQIDQMIDRMKPIVSRLRAQSTLR